ncbi:unnamed protein product [Prunus armeniaca]|uniref:Uncharacterized protein n=1 Tax=Prunus armeniaca TaxID=36596 RepID=A0A6J5WT23_PRUAR|nr:hypothetical protein GBA52_009519 [Prunus armeniaca]CAB4302822.1 unnamed protein product [Prunus armeniaca]
MATGNWQLATGFDYDKVQPPLPDHVAIFFDKDTYKISRSCLLDVAVLFGGSKLYMLLRECIHHCLSRLTLDSFKGHVFDTHKKSLAKFKGSKAHKPRGVVISTHEKLYHLEVPSVNPEPYFEWYDPHIDFWDTLPHVLSYIISENIVGIFGYAVYCNNILFSLRCCGISKFIAFHVRTKE